MSDPVPFQTSGEVPLSREEFDEFLNIFVHEVRNRLNAVGLEAADLAEQWEGTADLTRLLVRVRDCAAFLKLVRELLMPEDPTLKRLSVQEVSAKLRNHDLPARS